MKNKKQQEFWKGVQNWFDNQETLEGDIIEAMDEMLINKIGNKPQSITYDTPLKQQDNEN